jgi:uncharacterized protein YigE (DUF2233 family)
MAKRSVRNWTIGIAIGLTAFLAFAYLYAGGFVLYYMLGGTGWPQVSVTDFRLSHAMRRAWETPPPAVIPGAYEWQALSPGYDIAELPVLTDKEEIDRIFLVRIDPAQFEFNVLNKSGRSISQWERALPDAALIVNGSFFHADYQPSTPFISNGVAMGPTDYDAKAGAFVAHASGASVVDLSTGRTWQAELTGMQNAMVAYPLLVGEDGTNKVTVKSRWLSNRSFVASDSQGRIIVGSTKEAFFSLDALAEFLIASSLDLKVALNLDGGPVACQSVRAGGQHRVHVARWEAQEENGTASLIHMPLGEAEMPIVLVATPRAKPAPQTFGKPPQATQP